MGCGRRQKVYEKDDAFARLSSGSCFLSTKMLKIAVTFLVSFVLLAVPPAALADPTQFYLVASGANAANLLVSLVFSNIHRSLQALSPPYRKNLSPSDLERASLALTLPVNSTSTTLASYASPQPIPAIYRHTLSSPPHPMPKGALSTADSRSSSALRATSASGMGRSPSSLTPSWGLS